MAGVLTRFFVAVWARIALLLRSGVYMRSAVGMKDAPIEWPLTLGVGLLMMALFGHLCFGPWRHMKAAAPAGNWPDP